MGGLLHLVQRGGAWAGCGTAQSPKKTSKKYFSPSSFSHVSQVTPSLFTRWQYPCGKRLIKIHIICGAFAVKSWYRNCVK